MAPTSVSSLKGRVNTPTPKAPVFIPSTINEAVNPWAGGIKAQTTSYSGKSREGDKLPVIEQTPLKDPFGNYNPLIPQTNLTPTLTGAGVTSSESGIASTNKASISIPKIKVNKEIVDSANAKREQLGLSQVKAKDLPIPQPGSTADRLNNAISRGDYNSAFALSASNIMGNEVEYIKSTLEDASKGADIVGKYAETGYVLGAKTLGMSGMGLSILTNVGKNTIINLVKDTEDAPYKILKNLQNQSIGEVIESKGSSLLKGTYESSYSFKDAGSSPAIQQQKEGWEYVLGVSLDDLDISNTRSEKRKEILTQNSLDTGYSSYLKSLEPYTIAADITTDLVTTVATFGVLNKGILSLKGLSVTNNSKSLSAIASTLEKIPNMGFSDMARIGASFSVLDFIKYTTTGDGLGSTKEGKGFVTNQEFGLGMVAGGKLIKEGYKASAPTAKKLFTDGFEGIDTIIKSPAIKDLLNSSVSAQKEFIKAYNFAQTNIQKGLQSVSRGMENVGENLGNKIDELGVKIDTKYRVKTGVQVPVTAKEASDAPISPRIKGIQIQDFIENGDVKTLIDNLNLYVGDVKGQAINKNYFNNRITNAQIAVGDSIDMAQTYTKILELIKSGNIKGANRIISGDLKFVPLVKEGSVEQSIKRFEGLLDTHNMNIVERGPRAGSKPIESSTKAQFDSRTNTINLFYKDTPDGEIIHEFSHKLNQYVPDNVQKQVNSIYESELKRMVDKLGDTKEEKDALEYALRNYNPSDLDVNLMRKFREASGGENKLYRFKNKEEFFAEEMKDSFERGIKKQGVIGKLADYVRDLLSARRTLFNKQTKGFNEGTISNIKNPNSPTSSDGITFNYKEIPQINLPSITELNTNNIKEAIDIDKLKRNIKLDDSTISDSDARIAAEFQANTNKGVIATINNKESSRFIKSLEGFLPEGKDGLVDILKASFKKAGVFVKGGFDKGSYTRYLEKVNGSKISVTPDIGVRSISGKVDYIYNQFKEIQKSLGDGVADFQVYITNKRQYNLVVERENARKALSDELGTLGKSKEDIVRANEIKSKLANPNFQTRSVGGVSGENYIKGFELTSSHLDTIYAPQVKIMEDANDTFLSVLRDSGYISQETLDNLSKSDLYVKTKFIFDNADRLEKDFGRAPSVLKKIASGTEKGVLDYNLFKNMITHYTNGISSAMKNDSIRHIANVVQNNPAFKIVDESLGNNSIQFFVDGEKKFLTGPKFFLDDIAKSSGVKQSAIGQLRQSTIARVFALPTSIVKEFITGRLNPIFQPSQVAMEIANASLNSAANNKGGIRVDTIIPSLLNASGVKDDIESEALQILFKWMGGDSVNNFRTDMKGLFEINGLDKMMDDSFGIDKVKTPNEIAKEIATYPIKKISTIWHGYGNVLSEIETTTSRIPTFAGYIYKSMKDSGVSQKEFVEFYKNNGKNPNKLQKFLESKGVDVSEATQMVVDQFNYDRSGDLIGFLNMYIPYTRTGVEATIQTGRIVGKLGSGVAKGNLNAIGVSSTVTTIGSGIGYYLYNFNNTPDRRRMAEFDPTPEKPGFYIGWAKDKNGRLMVDEKIEKVEINALPTVLSDLVIGFQSTFNKISNGSVPGGDRIIDKYISSKIGLFNFETDTGLSISQLGTIASIIKDIKSPATNITDKTSAASVAISHYFPSYTPPQIDRLFRDVLGSTAAPVVKNLLVDAMESAGVDIEKLTKGGVDKYEDSKLHKYFGQDDLGKGLSDLLGDMVRVNRKEVGTMTTEEIKLMRESGKLNTAKLTDSQLIDQSIEKKLSNWDNMSKDERKSAVNSIQIEGMSKEDIYKKIVDKLMKRNESSLEKRVSGLSAENYNTLILGKIESTKDKAIKIRDDLKDGILTESKASAIIKLISK